MFTTEIGVANDQILEEEQEEREERIILETVFTISEANSYSDKVIQTIADRIAKFGIFLIMLYVYLTFVRE